MNREFWTGRRVFITGHTGFKGSWLSLWLQLMGAKVRGYALNPLTQPNLFELASVADGMESVIGDVRNLDNLCQEIADFQPEIVLHLAAQPLVRQSYRDPVTTYATNVMGTVHLLEAVRQVKTVRVVVNITSDKCYENREWVWGYRETDAMGGYDPYSSSKGCAELVAAAYRNSFFNPECYPEHRVALATARAGNVIGGGDWSADRLVPDILKSIVDGQRLQIRNPNATRPWQLVLEPLHGYLTLAEKLYHHGITFVGGWNFGPNDSAIQPVSWMVKKLMELWGNNEAWQLDTATSQPHETNFLKLDYSKARFKLGWEPTLELETALAWIVDWNKAWQAGADMRQVTESQIQKFMARLHE